MHCFGNYDWSYQRHSGTKCQMLHHWICGALITTTTKCCITRMKQLGLSVFDAPNL